MAIKKPVPDKPDLHDAVLSMLREKEWDDVEKVSIAKGSISRSGKGKCLLATKSPAYDDASLPTRYLIAVHTSRQNAMKVHREAEQASKENGFGLVELLARKEMYKRDYEKQEGETYKLKNPYRKDALLYLPHETRNKIRMFPKLEKLIASQAGNRLYYIHDKSGHPAVRRILPMAVWGDYRVVSGAPVKDILKMESLMMPHYAGDMRKMTFVPSKERSGLYHEPAPADTLPEDGFEKDAHRFERLRHNLAFNRKQSLREDYQGQLLKAMNAKKGSRAYEMVEKLSPDRLRLPRSYSFLPPLQVSDYQKSLEKSKNGETYWKHFGPQTFRFVVFYDSESTDRSHQLAFTLDDLGNVKRLYHYPGCKGNDSNKGCWHMPYSHALIKKAISREP